MMFIHQLTFKICGKITGPWNIGQGDLHLLCCQLWCHHNALDFITLNGDVINMSDAHPSLRSCLCKQTATLYFIEALINEIGFKICQNHWSMKIRSQWPWPYYTECFFFFWFGFYGPFKNISLISSRSLIDTECWCDKHVWCPSLFNKRLFV